MLGNINIKTFVDIPKVLVGQRVRIIFRVAGDKEAAVVLAFDSKNSGLIRYGQQVLGSGGPGYIQMVFRMPGMGDIKDIIKSPEQGGLFFYNSMWEDTEQFFGREYLGMP